MHSYLLGHGAFVGLWSTQVFEEGYTSEAIKQLLGMLQDLHNLGTITPEIRVEEAKLTVLSRLSRTLLQVGALQAAIGYCDMAVAQL